MTLTESSRKGTALAQFRQIYRWQLKRSRLISILCLGLTLLCFTVVHLCESARNYHDYFNSPDSWWENVTQEYLAKQFSNAVAYNLKSEIATILIPLLLMFLITSTIQTFQYMHKRRSVDLFHALPIRRTPLLLGNMAAIGTVLAVITILNLSICGVADMAMGATGDYNAGWLLGLMGYMLLLLAASLCGTVFLLVSCGTVSSAVIAGILLTVGWPLLVICGASIIQDSLPGCQLVASGPVLTALTPYLALFVPYSNGELLLTSALFGVDTYDSNAVFGSAPMSVGLILWWVLVTAVLLVGCILVYRKRKSEAAENNFSYPVLRIIIRFIISGAMGLGCAIFFGSLSKSNVVFYVTAVLASLLTHGITQVIWVRGFRELTRSLIYYAGLAVAMAVFFVGVATGGQGYVNRIPAVENVDYIRMELPGFHYDDSKETYLYNRSSSNLSVDRIDPESEEEEPVSFSVNPKLRELESIQTIQALHQVIIDQYETPYLPVQETGDYRCTLTYTLKDGSQLVRGYTLPGQDQDLGNTDDYTEEPHGTPELLKAMADVVHLDELQAFTLLDFYTPDRVENVRVEEEDEEGNMTLHREPAKELTDKQKKTVWDTFLAELNSDHFAWTYQETTSTVGETCYYIDVDANWPGTEWPEKLETLIRENSDLGDFDPEIKSKLTMNSLYYFSVPKSCTKTRALIDKMIGKNVQKGDVIIDEEDTY